MELPLQTPTQRRALLIASLALAALVSFQAIENWVADHRIHSSRLDIMERGAALEPGNADAWDRLGRYQQWNLANPDPNQAIADYLKAVQRDPHSAHYWMDLHLFKLGACQLSRFRNNRFRYRQLSDVMQDRRRR